MKEKKNTLPIILLLIAIVLLIALIFATLALNKVYKSMQAEISTMTEENTGKNKKDKGSNDEDYREESGDNENEFFASKRQGLLAEKKSITKPTVVANTTAYKAEADFSNVDNKDLYYFDEEKQKRLSEDYFYVSKSFGSYEFFEIYESNRYDYESSFITVDSLMHTYHLFFSHLLKSLEKDELSNAVKNMSEKYLAESEMQYEELKGTEWEDAAKRNIEYFAVAVSLSGGDVDTKVDVADVVNAECNKIMAASGIEKCLIIDGDEDYSQYKPRGYYDGDKKLEDYFRTMMWYGRIQFNLKSDEMVKSSILINLAMKNAGTEDWKDVYDITTFFVGSSDDLGYYEYYPLLEEVYGESLDLSSIADNSEGFDEFKNKAKDLRLPKVNSIPIKMGDINVIPGFRLMGQRFTIDAGVMQELVYQRVKNDKDGNFRMLPDFLDLPAALGSDLALNLLESSGQTVFSGYKENMEKLRKELSEEESEEYLTNSLYGNWINTLKPLLDRKGEGYPSFMQSEKWAKKDLETFAGSYTELKHDTVLYSKQVMAEMGDGEIPEFDDRGYVQPEPEVYSNFMYLADATREGLESRNRISEADSENLQKLSEIAKKLYDISEKELVDETLTNEEYDFIREYGGLIEHFWYDVTKADTGDDDINTEKYQAALVVDIATDPNGSVLEMATGQPCSIYVVVKVDGKVKIAKGAVFSFYQFEWPMSDRLTDTKWRQMMGYEPSEDGWYSQNENNIDIPWWTKDYSYVYTW